MASLKNLTINDTGFLKIPSGTSAQRPGSPSTGMLRYNTTIGDIEIWNGSKWSQNSLGTANNPATSVVALADAGYTTNGLYYMNIGDGRGNAYYYCVFDYPGGPWVMFAQNLTGIAGDAASIGILGTNTSANGGVVVGIGTGNIGTTSQSGIYNHFNSNIAGYNVPATGYMVTNTSGAIWYTQWDAAARNAFYTQWLDTAGQVSGTTDAQTTFTSTGAFYSNKTTMLSSWTSVGSIIEQHHGSWTASSALNYLIEVGRTSRSPGDGAYTSYKGIGNNGSTMFHSGTVYSGNNDYHFIKI